MDLRKVINKRIRHTAKGVDVVGDINAVVAANTGKRDSTHVSSRQRTRIVQQGGRTEVFHDQSTDEGGTRDKG
jgi:hypothetical protein